MSIVTIPRRLKRRKTQQNPPSSNFNSLVASKNEIAAMREQFLKGGNGYGDSRKQLFEKLWEYFAPMRKRREENSSRRIVHRQRSQKGATRANEIAEQSHETRPRGGGSALSGRASAESPVSRELRSVWFRPRRL